jgi:hypothetical protein
MLDEELDRRISAMVRDAMDGMQSCTFFELLLSRRRFAELRARQRRIRAIVAKYGNC